MLNRLSNRTGFKAFILGRTIMISPKNIEMITHTKDAFCVRTNALKESMLLNAKVAGKSWKTSLSV